MLGRQPTRVAIASLLGLFLCLPAASLAAVTVGATGGSGATCNPEFNWIQHATAAASPSYTIPAGGGVITSWRHDRGTGAATARLRLKLFTPAGGDAYVTAAHSEFEPLSDPGVNAFPSRIPVGGGEHLGLRTTSPSSAEDVDCLRDTVPEDVSGNSTTGDPDPAIGASPTFVFTNFGTLLNVSATLEPDADDDGFGDETQDQCPTNATTQGTCPPPDTDPPETTITKDAPKKTDRSKVEFQFTSDEPGSTFECAVDKKLFKPCESPKTVKRLDEGKHKFKVRAIDAAGNPDPTADKDKFKVVD